MQAPSMFEAIGDMTSRAMKVADRRAEEELSNLFRRHLMDSGLPQDAAQTCRVVLDEKGGQFLQEVNERAQKHSDGDMDTPGTAAIETFWNHHDPVEVHQKHIYRAGREVGLF